MVFEDVEDKVSRYKVSQYTSFSIDPADNVRRKSFVISARWCRMEKMATNGKVVTPKLKMMGSEKILLCISLESFNGCTSQID